MTYLNLIPRRGSRQTPARWGFDRLFEDFFRDIDAVPEGIPAFSARLDVAETDKAVTVTADLPGLE